MFVTLIQNSIVIFMISIFLLHNMLNKKVAILVHYSLIFRYKTDIPEKNLYINEPAHEIDILNA